MKSFRPITSITSLTQLFLVEGPGNNNVIVDIPRASTATESLSRFFRVVDQDNKAPRAVTMGGVGLRLGGVSACYDLYWFPVSGNIYATHGNIFLLVH